MGNEEDNQKKSFSSLISDYSYLLDGSKEVPEFKPCFDYVPGLKLIELEIEDSTAVTKKLNDYVSIRFDEHKGNKFFVGAKFEGIEVLDIKGVYNYSWKDKKYIKNFKKTKPNVNSDILTVRDLSMTLPDWNYNVHFRHLSAFWGKGPYEMKLLNDYVAIFRNNEDYVVGARLFGIERLVDMRDFYSMEESKKK